MKIALLIATALLFGAPAAMAQTQQPVIHKEAVASATTTKKTDGTVTTTQTSKTTVTAPVPTAAAPPAPKPVATPAPKAQPAPAKPAAAPVVHRSTGRERVLVGNPKPAAVVAMLNKSLQIDDKGNHILDPAHCSPNGDGCGTPNDLLLLFQKADPGYGLTDVHQLADYVGNNLVAGPVPEHLIGVKVWMGCLKAALNGKHVAVWNCLAREYHKGEIVYTSRKTGKLVNPGDCWNGSGEPDVKKIVDDCDMQIAWLNPGDEVHRFWLSNEGPFPDDKCNALMKAGEDEWAHILLDECPRDRCDASRPSRDLHMAVQGPASSFIAQVPGWYKWRVTRKVEHLNGDFVFCIIWHSGPNAGYQSLGTVIGQNAYHSLGEAYIVYPNGPKDQMPPPEWLGVRHTWLNSGERAPK